MNRSTAVMTWHGALYCKFNLIILVKNLFSFSSVFLLLLPMPTLIPVKKRYAHRPILSY